MQLPRIHVLPAQVTILADVVPVRPTHRLIARAVIDLPIAQIVGSFSALATAVKLEFAADNDLVAAELDE